jgi:hypothetical protein
VAIRIPPFIRTQEAGDTPFDNSTNGFPVDADNAQTAIEYSKNLAVAQGACITFGYNGNAGVGKELEWLPAVSSFLAPFISPTIANINYLCFSCSTTSTVTIGLYKDVFTTPILLDSLVVTSSQKEVKTVNLDISALDELGVRIISGSASKPVFFMFWHAQI